MPEFQVDVRVTPREGILDPQGKAVDGALSSLGFDGVSNVRVGRLITLTLAADSPAAAEATVGEMCRRILANPVIEDFEIHVWEAARR